MEGCEKANVSMVWLQSPGKLRGADENMLIENAFPDLIKGFGFIHLGVDDLYSRGFTGLKAINP